jgi:hydroxymethylglutaryl-CoA reductase
MFIEIDIETILNKLSKLDSSTKPLWGSMSAQRMVEHLTDLVQISNGKNSMEILIPEDKIEKMQLFIESDKPMAKNIEVAFVGKDVPLKNEELELAIDELILELVDFEEFFEVEGRTTVHPYYGALNFEQWKKMHSKHFTHHFEQFDLI